MRPTIIPKMSWKRRDERGGRMYWRERTILIIYERERSKLLGFPQTRIVEFARGYRSISYPHPESRNHPLRVWCCVLLRGAPERCREAIEKMVVFVCVLFYLHSVCRLLWTSQRVPYFADVCGSCSRGLCRVVD